MNYTKENPLKVLSLGGGVQSSVIALMIAKGELPMIDAAIFADTGHEPRFTRILNPRDGTWIEGGIYGWLDWLQTQVPFPIYRVSAGDLAKDSLIIKKSKVKGKIYTRSFIPAFISKPNGKRGILARKCTRDYKIRPIYRKIKQILGCKYGPKTVHCITMIGISCDEAHRQKPSGVPYISNLWPLIDKGMDRKACIQWINDNNYPIPTRSACTFCPFHGDEEWTRLKNESPKDFELVVKFEKDLQETLSHDEILKGVPYLHSSCVPISEVVLKELPSHQQVNNFGNECEGMCGV
jgi:hypothetical protein